MKAAITAIGTASPVYKQSQERAVDIVTRALQLKPLERRLLKSVYKSTGIAFRHSVMSDFCKEPGEYTFFPNDTQASFPTTGARMQVYKEEALPLALLAIKHCLNEWQGEPVIITHLITVSCTGMYAPGLDIEITEQLGLSSTIKRTAINFMGCYGAFNAIKVAEAICKADENAKVLVVSVELCTLHFQKNDSRDSIFSNAIFADGAAAVMIQLAPNDKKQFTLEAFHCDLLPQHSKEMAWHIADNGFDIVLSSYIPEAIQSGIAKFTERLLQQQTLSLKDLDFYAIHPGGSKILKACEAALTISERDNRYSYDVLRQHGNMSSATVLFVLKAIWDDIQANDKHKQIFSCAFGPGLTLEAMLLRVG